MSEGYQADEWKTVSAITELFYAWRIWVVSRGRRTFRLLPVLVLVVVALSLTQLSAGIAEGVMLRRLGRFSLLADEHVIPVALVCLFFHPPSDPCLLGPDIGMDLCHGCMRYSHSDMCDLSFLSFAVNGKHVRCEVNQMGIGDRCVVCHDGYYRASTVRGVSGQQLSYRTDLCVE